MPAWQGLPAVSGRGYKAIANTWPRKAPTFGVHPSVRFRSDVVRLQLAMARTGDSYESPGSAIDHSNTTGSGSFKSCSSSAVVNSMDLPELNLLASEALSLSDEDCTSNATPTFSDKSEATQAAAATAILGRYRFQIRCLVTIAASKYLLHRTTGDTRGRKCCKAAGFWFCGSAGTAQQPAGTLS